MKADFVIMHLADDEETTAWLDKLLAEKAAEIAAVGTHWDGAFENTAVTLRKKD